MIVSGGEEPFVRPLSYVGIDQGLTWNSQLGLGLNQRSHNGITSSKTEAEDEAIVNTALLLLLEAVNRLCRPANVEWTTHQVPLTSSFTEASFTAITDGALRSRDRKQILGSLEVKKLARSIQNRDAIRRQESAQTVGLVLETGLAFWKDSKSHVPLRSTTRTDNYSRLVVSQNAGEIYLAFADTSRLPDVLETDGLHQISEEELDYLDYLKDGTVDPRSAPFLNVQAYGPWRVENRQDMEQICVIIAAIILVASNPQSN